MVWRWCIIMITDMAELVCVHFAQLRSMHFILKAMKCRQRQMNRYDKVSRLLVVVAVVVVVVLLLLLLLHIVLK